MISHNILLHGEAVTFILKNKTGEDGFGDPVYESSEIELDNVLVAPGPSAESSENTRYLGAVVGYTLHVPKTFTDDLQGAEAIVRGVRCRVLGRPDYYNPAPGDWNRQVEVEVING